MSLRLRLLVATGVAVLFGDATRLRQVVDNLLANIRAHTPVTTACEVKVEADADAVTLTVSDNGPGVTDEELLHLFDRFYRVDEARARATGGSGLGLPIVAAIVHAHGGSISASRAEPSGLTVTMRLPRALPRRDASEELRDDADAN